MKIDKTICDYCGKELFDGFFGFSLQVIDGFMRYHFCNWKHLVLYKQRGKKNVEKKRQNKGDKFTISLEVRDYTGSLRDTYGWFPNDWEYVTINGVPAMVSDVWKAGLSGLGTRATRVKDANAETGNDGDAPVGKNGGDSDPTDE